MRGNNLVALICIFPTLLKYTTAVDQITFLQSNCSETGQYNHETAFQNNLYLLLSNLTSKSSSQIFYNFTTGEGSNKVYGLFLCGDVYLDQVCNDCVTIAAGEVERRCPSSPESTVWYAECMLRYSNRDIFSVNDDSVFYNVGAGKSVFSQYNQQLESTFISLFDQVSNRRSSSKSATTIFYITQDVMLDCYVDCTPDLSDSDCKSCLSTGLGRLNRDGAQIGRLLQPSCRLMYVFTSVGSVSQDRPFYITLGVTSAVAAVSLLLNVWIIYSKRKAKNKSTEIGGIESKESFQFDFNVIKAATNNFNPENKLGEGGFGVVYMGTLADGKVIAVKRLSNVSGQGIKEFKAEACLAVKLKHKNLVKLYGFSVYREEKLLVYEYMINNNLSQFLSDSKQGEPLNWETRYKIIVGIARGLLYLQEYSRPKIVHRDLKPSNVLLDADMNPKIADFGLAKLFGSDQTQGNTSRVAGTFGYMAPEYVSTGNFSAKSDIFSFGVIVLEIISGNRKKCFIPDEEDGILLDYARRLWDEGDYLKFIDPKLGKLFSEDEVKRSMKVGIMCTEDDPAKRPDMASVLLMLNTKIITTLPNPTRPPISTYKPNSSTHSVTSCDTQAKEMVADLTPR